VEGSGRDVIEIILQNLPGGTEKTTRNLSEVISCSVFQPPDSDQYHSLKY
jgi:hypothetical protein